MSWRRSLLFDNKMERNSLAPEIEAVETLEDGRVLSRGGDISRKRRLRDRREARTAKAPKRPSAKKPSVTPAKEKSAAPRCGLCDWRRPWNGEQSLVHTGLLNWMYGSKVHVGPDEFCGHICTVCEKELVKYLVPTGTGCRIRDLTPAERGTFEYPNGIERLSGIVPRHKWKWPYDEKGINTWRQRGKDGLCTQEKTELEIERIQNLSKARYDGPVSHERPKLGDEWFEFQAAHRRKVLPYFAEDDVAETYLTETDIALMAGNASFLSEGSHYYAGGGSTGAVDTKITIAPFAGAFDHDEYYGAEDRGNRAPV